MTGPSNQSATEGISASLNLGTLADAGSETAWAVNVAWGDSSTNSYAVSLGPVTESHTYAEEGIYSPSVTAVDQAGLSTASATFTVTVADAVEPGGAFTFTATEGQLSTVQQVATLTDAAGTDSHIGDLSATINWGDSTTSAATLLATSTPGVYTVEGSHTYAEYGPYSIQVSATDVGGSSVPLTATASTTVADASLSLAGALRSRPPKGRRARCSRWPR